MHCLVWQPGNIAQYALGGDGNRNTRIKIVGGVHHAIKHRPLYLHGMATRHLSQHTAASYLVAFVVFLFYLIIERHLARMRAATVLQKVSRALFRRFLSIATCSRDFGTALRTDRAWLSLSQVPVTEAALVKETGSSHQRACH